MSSIFIRSFIDQHYVEPPNHFGELGQKLVCVIEKPSDGSQRISTIEFGRDELIRNIYVESSKNVKGVWTHLSGDHFGNFERNSLEKVDKGCQTFDVDVLDDNFVNRGMDGEGLGVHCFINSDAVDDIDLHHHTNDGSLTTSNDLHCGFFEVGAEIEVIEETGVSTGSVGTGEPVTSVFPVQSGERVKRKRASRHGLDLSGVDVTASRAVRSKTKGSHPGLRKIDLWRFFICY